MWELEGLTLATFLCVVAGVASHGLKQYVAARRNGVKLRFVGYVGDHLAETATMLISAVVLWVGFPELLVHFPSLADSLGFEPGHPIEQGALSSWLCGFVGNSLADVLGGRVRGLMR